MRKLRRLVAALAGVAVIAVAVPAIGVAGQPVDSGHFNFTSDPYDDHVCGVPVTGVDRVVESFKQDASGAVVDNLNLTTTFTSAIGKSVVFHSSGVRKQSSAVDNGDGTITFTFVIDGTAPQVRIPNGPVIALSTGSSTLIVTADAAHPDHFLSFQFVRNTGLPHDGSGGCAVIAAYLTTP